MESISQKQLQSMEGEAPRLVVFLDTDNNIICQYVVGDDAQIFVQTVSAFDALIVLLAAYYVFDLEYPTVYCQMLGFLQHWVLENTYTGSKTSNYITFSDELSRSTDKPV